MGDLVDEGHHGEDTAADGTVVAEGEEGHGHEVVFVDDETEFEFEEQENEELFLFRNGSFIFFSFYVL